MFPRRFRATAERNSLGTICVKLVICDRPESAGKHFRKDPTRSPRCAAPVVLKLSLAKPSRQLMSIHGIRGGSLAEELQNREVGSRRRIIRVQLERCLEGGDRVIYVPLFCQHHA